MHSETWCPFHCPIETKDQWPSGYRNEFLNSIDDATRNRKLPLTGAQIPAWVDWGHLAWMDEIVLDDARIQSAVKLSRYRGRLSLNGSRLDSSLSIDHSSFSEVSLDGAEIGSVCAFNEVQIGRRLRARQARFFGGLTIEAQCALTDADFVGATFGSTAMTGNCFEASRDVHFVGASATFDEATFKKGVRIGATFEADVVSFKQTVFDADAVFETAQLGREGRGTGSALFDGAVCATKFVLARSQVYCGLTLRDIEVVDSLEFNQTTFHEPLTISWRESVAAIQARGATFHNLAVSGSVSGNADWSGAHFIGPVRFESRFGGDALFRDAQFDQSAIFDAVIFSGVADFSTGQGRSFGPISFRSARFERDASFEHRNFKQETSFRDATFVLAPRFYHADLHPSVTFGDISKFRDFSADAIKRYQTLRHKCEEQSSRHEEGLFQALEQRARRKSGEMPRTDLLFSALYDWFSLYGTSASRPLVALLGVWLLWTILFAVLASWPYLDLSAQISWQVIEFAALDSARNIAAPFLRFRVSSGWVAVADFTESLLALSLLAVFLLAIRWRFRRG